MQVYKALGKLGNIVAETSPFLSMFLWLSISGNIVAETKLASPRTKVFPNKFRSIFVAETMFPSLPICFQVFPVRKTLFSRLDKLKQCFKTIGEHKQYFKICASYNVSQETFPGLPTLGKMKKT